MSNENRPVITVIGSVNIDFSVTADKLPQPGESVIGKEFLRTFGGKGANQAVGISRLAGGGVRFIGAVGDDPLGADGIESLGQNGVDTEFVRVVKDVSTGVALIMIDEKGENCIVAAPGANSFVDEGYVASLPEEVFSTSSRFVLCQEIPIESLEIIARRAREFGVPVLFNPAPPNPRLRHSDLLDNVDYVTPNETEAAAIMGVEPSTLQDELGQVQAITELARGGKKSVAITLGKQGCFVYDSQTMEGIDEAVRVDAPTVQAVDTTAAGDSFNAALAVALVEGKTFQEACLWANHCAAISVTRRGAQPSLPVREDLPEELR